METTRLLLLMLLLGCCLAEMPHAVTVSEKEDNEVTDAQTTTRAEVQQTCQPDIHTVLREMSVLIAEQGVELRHAKTQMEAMGSTMEHLQRHNQAQAMNLSAMEARLQATEAALEEQRVLSTEARHTLQELQSLNEGKKVAFALSLESDTHTYRGPYNKGMTLIYKHIFINTDNVYDNITGFFSAPVRGVYEFHFHVIANDGPFVTGVFLRKNKQNQVMVFSYQDKGMNNASNGVSLLLEVGDKVDIYLPKTYRVLDNGHHHSTFRGHLLFQL